MTGLNADYGRLICGSFKPYGQPVQTYRIDHTEAGRKEPWNDRDLAVQLRDALEGEFLVYSYNGVMFDLKFLDSRLLAHGERPTRRPMHKDLMFVAKNALAISSNRLLTVQEHLNLPVSKTRLDPSIWLRAQTGDTAAIDYVVEHCEADVEVLERVFEYLKGFIKVVYK